MEDILSEFSSPVRQPKLTIRLDQVNGSSPLQDISRLFPWNWGEGLKVPLSPLSPGSNSCESSPRTPNSTDGELTRRGRPRADSISSMVIEGCKSPNTIRCKVCNRVFPREKSLQAHMRTHTGERPYTCDYPGCARAFCQSGQLKTHQRLHTGEKPFMCSYKDCSSRFAHANRHCTEHPFIALKRDENPVTMEDLRKTESRQDVLMWLGRYYELKSKSPPTKIPNISVKRRLEPIDEEPAKRHADSNCMLADNEGHWSMVQEPRQKSNEVLGVFVEQDKLLGALALIELAQTRC